MSKETDELADALFGRDEYPTHHENVIASQDDLRQLARDAAALGAVKALEDAADGYLSMGFYEAWEVRLDLIRRAATYTDQERDS